MASAVEKGRDRKMRVHVDIDRRLWLRFKGRVAGRGDTLTNRLKFLIQRDLKEPASDPTSAA